VGTVNDTHDRNDTHDPDEPRWLRLAAAFRATPEPGTLARVHARLAARAATPAWVRWLSRPVALAASAALLVVSAFAGGVLLTAGGAAPAAAEDETSSSVVSVLLGDDGSYGMALGADTPAGTPGADSGKVAP
jgi:hypothetical protein